METKLIKGLNQIQSNYDAFFIDLWGVIHNGIKLYPGAVEVLENLNKLNKRFILMSNAPRLSKTVEKFSYCPLHLIVVFQPRGKKEDLDNEDEIPQFIEKKIKSA